MRTQMFAYLDPGTGSYVVQIVIGAIVGVGVAVGVFWRKIVSLFTRPKGKDKNTGQ